MKRSGAVTASSSAAFGLPNFRKPDDLVSDHFVSEVGGAINSRSSSFECDAHETGGLRIEGLAA